MARREVQGRYRGSVMGLLWSFFNPLFMLAGYTLVLSVVLPLGVTALLNNKIHELQHA